MKPTKNQTVINRRANFDYHLDDNLTVGMALSGIEVRKIRDHHVQLKGSFVTLKNNELWLNNLTLSGHTIRNIKLLATKKQLLSLQREKQAGKSIVPTKLLTNSRYIKLIIATGTGKKKYDKRQTIKNRDLNREKY